MRFPSHPWFATSSGDIVRLVFPPVFSDEELAALYDAAKAWWPTVDRPVAFVTNLTPMLKATARQRAMAAEYERDVAEYTRRWVRGVALVVPGPFLRGVVTAVFWMSPPPFPYKLFANAEAAEAWAQAQLQPPQGNAA